MIVGCLRVRKFGDSELSMRLSAALQGPDMGASARMGAPGFGTSESQSREGECGRDQLKCSKCASYKAERECDHL